MDIMTYDEFISTAYDPCRKAPWFEAVTEACSKLTTTREDINAVIGQIHEGLRDPETREEAVEYFWTIFLINPLIAIRARQETDLLKEIDIYGSFKHINPVDPYTKKISEERIYNPSVENFLTFGIEALLQKSIYPGNMQPIYKSYLDAMYNHDRDIMNNKKRYLEEGLAIPEKWITHRNLLHILKAIDPHHIIIFLSFFANKYAKRLEKGHVYEYSYSGDKYNFIISYIQRTYGSLSEYILWDDSVYWRDAVSWDIQREGYYRGFYLNSLRFDELYRNIDVVFPTREDKERIAEISGVSPDDERYGEIRKQNRERNERHRWEKKKKGKKRKNN